MARTVVFWFVIAILFRPSAFGGQEKKDPGSATWSEGFPRVANGGVDVMGAVAVKPGFKFVEIELYKVEMGGGMQTSLGKLETGDGMWGDRKENKIVVKHVELPKGKWWVWAQAKFRSQGSDGVIEYYSEFKNVEIK